jgi:cytochrome c oxidase subunit 3
MGPTPAAARASRLPREFSVTTATAQTRDIDVSELPGHAFGHRAVIWWANLMLVAIELTAFALLFASTLYLRDNFKIWPTLPNPPLLPASIGVGFAVASVPSILAAMFAARREDRGRTIAWLVVTTVLGVGFAACRAWEFATLPWQWDTDAHASCVWTASGLHAFELAAGVGENAFFFILLACGRFERKTFADIEGNGIFWLFIVGVWLPFYALIYWGGRA